MVCITYTTDHKFNGQEDNGNKSPIGDTNVMTPIQNNIFNMTSDGAIEAMKVSETYHDVKPSHIDRISDNDRKYTN